MAEHASPQTPQEATRLLVARLRQAIAMHHAGRAEELADDFDEVQLSLLPIPPTDQPTATLALNFWDSWADAARHEWQYYPGIEKEDWPTHAGAIIDALEQGHQVREPVLVRHFAPKPSLWRRLRTLFVGDDKPSA